MICTKCGSDGPFYDSAREGTKAYGQCQSCLRGASSKLGKEIKKARRAKSEMVVDLPCRFCKKILPSTEFAPSAAASIMLGFPGTCKVCRRPVDKAKYEKRKQTLRAPDDYSDLV